MAEKRIYELISIITLTSSISLLIYPDLFLSAKIRFNSGHDITIPFQAFLYNFDFLKESYFNHWNIYDQTNHTFFHFTQGFYTFPAIVAEKIIKISHLKNPKNKYIIGKNAFLANMAKRIIGDHYSNLLIKKFFKIKN